VVYRRVFRKDSRKAPFTYSFGERFEFSKPEKNATQSVKVFLESTLKLFGLECNLKLHKEESAWDKNNFSTRFYVKIGDREK
jgi:hypothetical protein